MVQLLPSLSPTNDLPSSPILPVMLMAFPMVSLFVAPPAASCAKAAIVKAKQHTTNSMAIVRFIEFSLTCEFARVNPARRLGCLKEGESYREEEKLGCKCLGPVGTGTKVQ